MKKLSFAIAVAVLTGFVVYAQPFEQRACKALRIASATGFVNFGDCVKYDANAEGQAAAEMVRIFTKLAKLNDPTVNAILDADKVVIVEEGLTIFPKGGR